MKQVYHIRFAEKVPVFSVSLRLPTVYTSSVQCVRVRLLVGRSQIKHRKTLSSLSLLLARARVCVSACVHFSASLRWVHAIPV